jgi:hypothetical protein
VSGPKRANDVVNNFGIVLIGVVSAILVWVSVVALQAYYDIGAGKLELERLEAGQEHGVRELKAKQTAALHELKWLDQKKGTVAIDIDSAMAMVVRDAKAGAPSLVPAIGPHDLATVPALPGRPADAAAAPAPAPAGAPAAAPAPAPAGAAAPAPAGAPAAAPAGAPAAAAPSSAPGGNQDAPAPNPR